ncbi:hypothetical protein [Kitasatospora phosalacinea]|uniref:Uncharacterized protein n=1 Tax=Kitasatospora phosalacinea TaxID=2065 RepID=A0A9W6PD07_9ACTN|nr:hypothetical protein [Kitasatospora phosalacinea]GLW53574.1 hypothetical protein Kpho01_15850 [Kitasatospora phosalacinea]
MHPDWDLAHTHLDAPTEQLPTGLTATPDHWSERLQRTPGGHLLRPDGNAMLTALTTDRPMHLLHLTRSLDAIRTSGHLLASTGCLAAALYGAPLTELPGGALRPHNLGTHLLDTRPDLDSRRDSTPLVIEVSPDHPAPGAGLDYLRLGAVHLRAFDRHRHALTPTEDHQVTRSVTDRIRAAAPLLDLMLATATGRIRPDAGAFLDQLAAAVPVMPYLGYLYFETAAEYLMLHSTSTATKNLAELGEMNNHLYKQLAFTAVDTMGTLFDVGRFRPGRQRFLDLIDGIEPGLSQHAAAFVHDRLCHRFTATALTPAADATAFAFTDADADDLRTAAAPLLGQLLFREVRLLDRYPQLYHLFEQEKAAEAWTYWNRRRTALPYNATCGPKGEIGVNPANPHARITVWTAERCVRGLLHPTEQVAAVPAPRLAPWVFTPLRDRTDEELWNSRPVLA